MSAYGIPSSELLSQVTAAIRGVLQDPSLELTPTTSLEDIQGWDSMDLIAVIVELECRFDLLFELPEIDTFFAVGDMVQALAARTSLNAA